MSEEFSQEFVPKSNWFKFEEIGNSIKGTLVRRFAKEGTAGLPDQEIFELTSVETDAGVQEGTWMVGIKKANQYVLSRLQSAKLGQRIGFKFTEEIPSKTKGMNPAKSLTPYLWGMDETYVVKEEFGGTEVTPFDS